MKLLTAIMVVALCSRTSVRISNAQAASSPSNGVSWLETSDAICMAHGPYEAQQDKDPTMEPCSNRNASTGDSVRSQVGLNAVHDQHRIKA